MKGPDFELPPIDPPAPDPEPVGPTSARSGRRPVAAVAGVVALALVAVALGGVAAYWDTGRPAAAPSTVPQAATTTAPATTTTILRTNVRTCSNGEDGPLQIQQAGLAGAAVTLHSSPRVSAASLVLITNALSEARLAYGDSNPLDVLVHCDVEQYVSATNRDPAEVRQELEQGLVAQVARGDIWIYGPNFDRPGVVQRRVVYHEYFHAVQRFLSRNRSSQAPGNPLWLVEGSARYFEHAVLPQDLDAFRQSQLRRWSAMPPLAELEQAGGGIATGGSGEAYTVGSVASDYLVNRYGRERLQHDVWAAMARTDWRSAFIEVFGVTVDDFYAQFEAYRQTLRP